MALNAADREPGGIIGSKTDDLAMPSKAPELITSRLILRPLSESDAPEMGKILAAPALYIYMGGQPPSVGTLTARYRRLLAGPPGSDEWWGNWVLVRRGGLVGTVQASIWLAAGGRAEVAWVVGVDHQRQGLAKEAAGELVDWLLSLGLARVEAHIHPDHAASAGVAISCGLAPTGELADGEIVWRRELRAG